MKKHLLAVLLCLGFSCGKALAQDSLHVAPPKVVDTILGKLQHELSLDDKQKGKVRTLLLERSQKFDQIKQNNSASKFSKADFKEVNEQALRKLKSFLTQEQFEKLQALRQETQRQKSAYKEEAVYRSLQDLELDF